MAGGNRVNELKKLAFFLGGAAAASFPYLANGWIFTGNPFYPLIFGGLHWVEANRQIMLAFGCPGTDFNPGNIGSIAGVLVRFFTVEQPVALLALPLIFLVRFPGMPAFLAAWLGAVVVWSLFIPCLRFMMPVYAALALMSGAGIGSWMKANPGRRWLAIWVVCISAGLGALHAVAAADSGKRSFNAAVGLEQPGMYLRRILSSYYRAVVEVNRLVPPGERILAVSERKGYLFNALVFNREIEDTPAMLEKVRESDSPQRLMIRLKQKGFGYILHNYVTSLYRSYWHSGHFIWRNDEVARYWRARDFLEPVWIDSAPDGANGGYVLYRILDKRESGRQHVYFLPGSESAGAEYWGEKPESYLGRMEKLNAIAPGVVFFEACLAHAYMGAGKNREAIEVLGHGLGIGSKYPEKDVLRYVKGVALGRLGRKREAIEELRKAEHESEVPENRDVFREEVEKLEEMR
jgi:tetratricopeptide (TPR) repeat protein